MAIIFIPTALRLFTEGVSQVDVNAQNIEEAINELVKRYGDLETHLFTSEKKLRSFVNVYLNEEDIRQIDGLKTKVTKSDNILLVPSIAGGSNGEKRGRDSFFISR